MSHDQALAHALKTANKPGIEGGPGTWMGRWVNQMGSVMELDVKGSEVTGVYRSKTSATSAGDGPITSTSLRGFVAGDLISFVVLWPGGSMTAWTGQMVDDDTNPRIMTLWHLVTEIPDADEKEKLWLSTLAGADEFTRR